MLSIPDIIHQPQSRFRQPTIHRMILDDDRGAGDSCGLAKQNQRVFGVVQYIDKHHRIEAVVLVWDVPAVKLDNRDMGQWTDQHVDAADGQIRPALHQQVRYRSVATADIQCLCILWQQLCQMPGEHPDSPAENIVTVNAVNKIHMGRFIAVSIPVRSEKNWTG